jgi:hypothetical protein
MSHEHLYRELLESERIEDHQNRQNLAMKELGKVALKPVDHAQAMKRFEAEWAPVFRARERARTSRAYRIWLKATGQWKGMEPGDVEVIDPSKGLKLVGPTIEDVQREIAANPAAFKHLAKQAPQVGHVAAERRTSIEPKLNGEPRDDS